MEPELRADMLDRLAQLATRLREERESAADTEIEMACHYIASPLKLIADVTQVLGDEFDSVFSTVNAKRPQSLNWLFGIKVVYQVAGEQTRFTMSKPQAKYVERLDRILGAISLAREICPEVFNLFDFEGFAEFRMLASDIKSGCQAGKLSVAYSTVRWRLDEFAKWLKFRTRLPDGGTGANSPSDAIVPVSTQVLKPLDRDSAVPNRLESIVSQLASAQEIKVLLCKEYPGEKKYQRLLAINPAYAGKSSIELQDLLGVNESTIRGYQTWKRIQSENADTVLQECRRDFPE